MRFAFSTRCRYRFLPPDYCRLRRDAAEMFRRYFSFAAAISTLMPAVALFRHAAAADTPCRE